jgi:hypothetical protein
MCGDVPLAVYHESACVACLAQRGAVSGRARWLVRAAHLFIVPNAVGAAEVRTGGGRRGDRAIVRPQSARGRMTMSSFAAVICLAGLPVRLTR